MLKGLLDTATLLDFQTRFEAEGEVDFAEFWEEIDREFGRDANHQNKQAWMRVRLNQAGKRLTSAEWRAFEKEFILRRNRVTDRTEAQEYELILAQLNRYWGDEVAKAESRKNTGEHWVKMLNLPHEMTRAELETILRRWDLVPRRVNKIDNGFMVSFDMESDRAKLLRYQNYRVGDSRISLSRARVKLTPTEIFDFISDRLQTLEGAEDLRRAMHVNYDERGSMHAVDVMPARREEKVVVVDPPAREEAPEKSTRNTVNRDPPPSRPPQPKPRPHRSNSPAVSQSTNPAPRRNDSPHQNQVTTPQTPQPPLRTNSVPRGEGPNRTDWGQRPSNQFRGRDPNPRPPYNTQSNRPPFNSQINQTSGEKSLAPTKVSEEPYYPFKPSGLNRQPTVNAVYQAPGPRVQT